jgi:hypothetical protein
MALFGIHFMTSKQLAAMKAEVSSFAMTEAGKAVAILKTTEIGKAVAADIAAVSNKRLSGSQKFEKVVASTAPLIVKYVTGGGFAAVEADVVDIARNLVQSVYNDFKSSTAPNLAKAILKIVGIG